MKTRLVLVALVSFTAGIGVAMVYPAVAQQISAANIWEITMNIPGGPNTDTVIAKHNRVTGETLILTCGAGAGCNNKDKWLELPTEVVK